MLEEEGTVLFQACVLLWTTLLREVRTGHHREPVPPETETRSNITDSQILIFLTPPFTPR